MRELRFVMQGEDDAHVVVETSSNVGFERFRLPITAELRDALGSAPTAAAEEPTSRPSPRPKPVVEVEDEPPAISPREIQVRVRAGERPEQIAETFNASLDWVMRFAGPVIEERGRVTDEARRARARRSTADAQTVIFGETVDARFSGHGIDPALVGWDSHRREDGQWVITASWIGGEHERTAEWAFSLSSRTVTAIDETASDLLSDRPIRPVFTDAPVTLSTAPPLAPGVVAFPARPNAHTGPLPTREQLFDQHAFGAESGPVPAPAPMAPIASIVRPVAEPTAFDPMPLPLDIEMPVTEDEIEFEDADEDEFDTVQIDEGLAEVEADEIREQQATTRLPQVTNLGVAQRPREVRTETEEEKAARAHIPSWDDILLGVRRKND